MDRVIKLMQVGSTAVPNLLLRTYRQIGLTDEEMIVLIHLLSFQQEGVRFPSIQQLENCLTMPVQRLTTLLQKLMKEGWIAIEEEVHPDTGIRSESYRLDGVFRKLLEHHLGQNETVPSDVARPIAEIQEPTVSLYDKMEQLFGRPLSPFEIETVQMWTQQDRYPEELILAALREAELAGKLFIRYIDRILLEWQRQNITTAEQARKYSMRFRRNVRT